MLRTAAAVLALAAASAPALAATRRVPSEEFPTIQSAINGVGTDDLILVGKGTYAENVTISGNNPFTLRGVGNPVIDGSGGSCLYLQSASNVSVSGFVLEGGSIGVHATGCQFITLGRLSVDGISGPGFYFTGGCHDITVSKCSVTNTGQEGVLDVESDNLIVSKCRFTGTGLASVALSPNYFTDSSTGSANALVEKCTITLSGAVGIHWGGNGVTLSKNRITGSDSIGIFNDASTTTMGSTVEKNRVTGAGDEGICISGSANTVSKNTVTDAQGNGIQVEGFGHFIEKNRIRSPNLSGIFVTGSGGHTLEGNSVAAADIYGIHVATTGNTLTRNRAAGSGQSDLYDDFPQGVNTYDGNRFGTTIYGP